MKQLAVLAAVLVVLVATLASVGRVTGSAAATSFPCAGAPSDQPVATYPEPRIFLEDQAWWTPMPGKTAADDPAISTGHLHIGACFPLYQHVGGTTMPIDIKTQEHEFQGQNVNIFRFDSYQFTPAWLGPPGTCANDTCVQWSHFDWPLTTSQTGSYNPPPGQGQDINMYLGSDLTNGNEMRNVTLWPLLVDNGRPPADPSEFSCTDPCNLPTSGESWYTGEASSPPFPPPSDYAAVDVARADIEKIWDTTTGDLVPKSGTFTINPQFWQPGARAMVDPAFHASPPSPGTVLLDTTSDLHQNHVVTIDTTKFSDGVHRLVLENSFARPSGTQSGLLVIPFLVKNDTTTTTSTTTTTTPTTTTVPSGYHPACEPNCDAIITDLRDRLAKINALSAP